PATLNSVKTGVRAPQAPQLCCWWLFHVGQRFKQFDLVNVALGWGVSASSWAGLACYQVQRFKLGNMFFGGSVVSTGKVEDMEDDDVFQYAKTELGSALATLEGLLRCGICRAICDPPVSLPCCQQAYCSLCIRKFLDVTNPRCPKCRNSADPNQLRLSRELRKVRLWK
ncbi:unnamed protein product, partial [Discosporangium mesarthrocarpum]